MTATAPSRRGPWYDAADVACAGLGIGLGMATMRLFSNGAAVLALCTVALGAWGLASVLRRTRIPGRLADTLHLAIGAVLLLVLAAPSHRWGVLPTPASLQAMVDAIRDDFGRFDNEVAPVVARTGHMAVMATLVWVLALFNSTGAMRFRAPVQAVVPHLVAFVGLGFVAREEGRLIASTAMLVALGLYALTQVAWRNATIRWAPRSSQMPLGALRSGAALLAAAAVVTAVVTPLIPGDAEPVVDLRRGGLGDDGRRSVVSPFVEVTSSLGPRSNELLFTIEAPQAQYWRLTALDTYDEDHHIWVLKNSYSAVEGEIGQRPSGTDETALGEVKLDVRGLGGIWVPAPADPATANAGFGLSWDGDAQSLIRSSGELVDGDAVDFTTTQSPAGDSGAGPDPATLRVTPVADARSELFDATGAPPRLVQWAQEVSADPSAPYDTLLAMQAEFREDFSYDESVDLSGEADPLDTFLTTRRGFCQQFSTAFALAARSLGYPARVVVGFTAGDLVEDRTDERSVFAVRGRHAHAWPEVRFAGVGWVPFEPTPGRGNPATTGITGVPGAQAAPPEPETAPAEPPTTSAVPTTQAAGSGASPTTTGVLDGVDPRDPDVADPADPGGSADPVGSAWPVVVGASILVLLGVALYLRRRGGSSGPDVHDPVAREWQRALRAMSQRGLTMAPVETPDEFARQCDIDLDLPAMVALAELESARRWSGRPTDESDADSAREAGTSITQRLTDLDALT